jgi:hypothetical protein
MATKKRRRFAEGGISEAADKEAGLKASKGDKVGFFERLRMGNIDQEGSEAYNRFGAGRAKADRDMASEAAAMKKVDEYRASRKAEPEMDELEAANAREPIFVPAGPKAELRKPGGKPSVGAQASKPAKTTAKKEAKSEPKADTSVYSNEGRSTPYAKTDTSNYSNEGRGRQMTKKQQAEYGIDSIRPTTEQTQQGLETASTMMGGAGLKTLQGLAKKMAKPKMATYTQPALSAPTPRLPYDKAGAVGRARDARAAARQEEMLAENAARYGLDPKAPGYEAAAGAIRKELGGKDFSFKRGGAVKKSAKPMKKMASGGSTSGASKRGDGIAQRGHTRGKIY